MSKFYLPWNASKARKRDAERATTEPRGDRQRAVLGPRLAARSDQVGTVHECRVAGADWRPQSVCRDGVRQRRHASRASPLSAPSHSRSRCRASTCCRASRRRRPEPVCQRRSEHHPMAVDPAARRRLGPVEGRPPGPVWAHQRFERVPAADLRRSDAGPARSNTSYNPRVRVEPELGRSTRRSRCRCGSTRTCRSRIPNSVWTFNGTIPPKLVQGRYGEPILFRHYNGLPTDIRREQRLRAPHHLDARAQRPPRRGERRLHRRVLLPGPVLRLPLADRARRLLQHQHRRTDPHGQHARTAAAG